MEQIKKYMQNRKLITFVCDCCGKEAQKPLSEYNRNKKLGRKNFCSRIRQFLKQISSYTSHFCEDETISSPKEVLGAQAGN